jgi:hypothetical protein
LSKPLASACAATSTLLKPATYWSTSVRRRTEDLCREPMETPQKETSGGNRGIGIRPRLDFQLLPRGVGPTVFVVIDEDTLGSGESLPRTYGKLLRRRLLEGIVALGFVPDWIFSAPAVAVICGSYRFAVIDEGHRRFWPSGENLCREPIQRKSGGLGHGRRFSPAFLSI